MARIDVDPPQIDQRAARVQREGVRVAELAPDRALETVAEALSGGCAADSAVEAAAVLRRRLPELGADLVEHGRLEAAAADAYAEAERRATAPGLGGAP